MDEQESDLREHPRLRRYGTLAVRLWGSTTDDLRRQLVAPYPKIPLGWNLEDFRELQRIAQRISSMVSPSRTAQLPPFPWTRTTSPDIFVGAQRFTPWEACCEILRRAIVHLETR